MPDPTPAPEWAVKMAASYGESWDHTTEERNDLALLLASVRDAALREAADAVVDNVARWLDAERAILALIGTAPKEADAMTDDEAFELLAEMAHDIRCPCETCKADRAEMAKEDWSDPDAR